MHPAEVVDVIGLDPKSFSNYFLHIFFRLTADLLKKAKPRSRGDPRSNLSITDRLGFRGGVSSLARSASRKSEKSNQNLLQQSPLQARVSGKSASRQHLNPQIRENQMHHRSNSHIHANGNEQTSRHRRRLIRRSSRTNLRQVSSVIDRINVRRGGINATQPNVSRENRRIRRGGIAQRRNSNARNQPINAGKQEAAAQSSSR